MSTRQKIGPSPAGIAGTGRARPPGSLPGSAKRTKIDNGDGRTDGQRSCAAPCVNGPPLGAGARARAPSLRSDGGKRRWSPGAMVSGNTTAQERKMIMASPFPSSP
ncbi:hypothetical protein NL676_000824 [Syzygium grande]|nr:hypothetical protein NL676_000824 [Syzygium grande]